MADKYVRAVQNMYKTSERLLRCAVGVHGRFKVGLG